jgi:ABC-type branched-subunit amino acid transport system ATPase component
MSFSACRRSTTWYWPCRAADAGSSFRFWRPVRDETALFDDARSYLDQVGLSSKTGVVAGQLSHGEQRALELAMALATRPQLLLLDEPMAGTGPEESARMVELIEHLARHVTILLVEHDMAVFRLADRISVLVNGQLICSRHAGRGEERCRRAPRLSRRPPVSALLEISGLEVAYGPSQVLFGIDLNMADGEAATLLGRNGMGKTTTLRAICGLQPVQAGSIRFAGEEIAGWRPDRIGRAGIALVPEGRQCFPNLTVDEHLVAFFANRRGLRSPWTPAVSTSSRACRSGRKTWAISFPAASSRCWPSAAPWSPTRACSSSTKPPRAGSADPR